MEYVKKIGQAFLVGGLLSILGQIFMVILIALLGPDSMFVGPLTLILMGVFALITFPLGIYKKIEDFGGFGAILPFSGLAAAVAGSFCAAKAEKGSTGAGIAAGVKLVVYVVGIGSIAALVVALIMTFVL